ncbi:MAG: DUF3276 family protein [Bacteroidales bacterium]
MEESAKKDSREEIFSKVVRAGKRTYFFDVKETRNKERYLTITESKRRFNNENGKFFYEKHKLFLYKEDFEKFSSGLTEVIGYIEAGQEAVSEPAETPPPTTPEKKISDMSFEDLEEPGEIEGKDDEEKRE